MDIEINVKAKDIHEMFGYESMDKLLKDSLKCKKLGALVSFVTTLAMKLPNEVTIALMTYTEIITGRKLDGVADLMHYMNRYLSEKELLELSAKFIMLGNDSLAGHELLGKK